MPLPIRNPSVCPENSFFLSNTLDTDGIERTLYLPPEYLGAISSINVIFSHLIKNWVETQLNELMKALLLKTSYPTFGRTIILMICLKHAINLFTVGTNES